MWMTGLRKIQLIISRVPIGFMGLEKLDIPQLWNMKKGRLLRWDVYKRQGLGYGQVGGGYEYVVLISDIDWQDALIVIENGQGIFFISSFYTIS